MNIRDKIRWAVITGAVAGDDKDRAECHQVIVRAGMEIERLDAEIARLQLALIEQRTNLRATEMLD